MKTVVFLFINMLFLSISGFSTTWTVTSSGNSFTPSILTITEGDTVNFVIVSSHNVQEVSATTYNANGSTALPNGFSTPYGGGKVFPAQLTEGTHYYVCVPHASIGMTAKIIVNKNTTDIKKLASQEYNILLFPNPASTTIYITSIYPSTTYSINDITGNTIMAGVIFEESASFDVSQLTRGIYFIQFNNNNDIKTKKIILK